MQKDETLLVQQPFVNYLKHKGWHVEKTHGSQFQQGFPDLYAMHPIYGTRWIEVKVLRDGNFSFEESQKRKFPIWIAHGVPIWIIFGENFTGVNGIPSLHKAYLALFKEANAPYMINHQTRKLLLR